MKEIWGDDWEARRRALSSNTDNPYYIEGYQFRGDGTTTEAISKEKVYLSEASLIVLTVLVKRTLYATNT